jgi:malonyl CoA-acyl carrier protein transacylase
MSARIPIVVVCPGRGTYTKEELGYLKRHRPKIDSFVGAIDSFLQKRGEPTVSELDHAERFSLKTHTPGEYASTLIYACSAADFYGIDQERYEIVAITGNSMGWYTALALAGALRGDHATELIHSMGSMMKDGVIGGQLIYPVTDDQWRMDPSQIELVEQCIADTNKLEGLTAQISIHFGGYLIIGGNEAGLKHLMKALPPKEERYPFILVNHAAFHTELMHETSERAFATLGAELFSRSEIPLIDGRGKIWQPYSTDLEALRQYTLGHQVFEPYDFSQAMTTALREFGPEKVVLLGPGATSGGAIGQVMIDLHWKELHSKEEFLALQKKEPFLVSMGREDQQTLVAGNARNKN